MGTEIPGLEPYEQPFSVGDDTSIALRSWSEGKSETLGTDEYDIEHAMEALNVLTAPGTPFRVIPVSNRHLITMGGDYVDSYEIVGPRNADWETWDNFNY